VRVVTGVVCVPVGLKLVAEVIAGNVHIGKRIRLGGWPGNDHAGG